MTANVANAKIMPDSELEARYERYKGVIKNFTLMSDIFMRNVFKQRECLEYVLQCIICIVRMQMKCTVRFLQNGYMN